MGGFEGGSHSPNMKRLITLLILSITLCGTMMAQNALFRKYGDMDNVKYVNIGRSMLEQMAKNGKTQVGGVNITGLGIGMPLNAILIISTTQADIVKQMKEDDTQIASSDYNTLIVTREGKNHSSSIYYRKAKPHNELVMFVVDGEETTFIVMTGSFSQKDVEKMFL